MKWKFPLAAVIFAIIAQVIHSLGAILGMKYYLMPEYFNVWSKLMMPNAGPPPSSFYLYSLGFGLIGALLLAWVYIIVEKAIPGKTAVKKGLMFGLLLIMIASIPGTLSMLILINLPAGLVFFWFVEGALIYLLGGMVFAGLLKK
ncbi:hypothetical protein KKC32_05325 [Patescibacteria group bacterium]|nr:hypothetical protein [Patescibacteria group bacterium]